MVAHQVLTGSDIQ